MRSSNPQPGETMRSRCAPLRGPGTPVVSRSGWPSNLGNAGRCASGVRCLPGPGLPLRGRPGGSGHAISRRPIPVRHLRAGRSGRAPRRPPDARKRNGGSSQSSTTRLRRRSGASARSTQCLPVCPGPVARRIFARDPHARTGQPAAKGTTASIFRRMATAGSVGAVAGCGAIVCRWLKWKRWGRKAGCVNRRSSIPAYAARSCRGRRPTHSPALRSATGAH